jgi:hypothetical protein
MRARGSVVRSVKSSQTTLIRTNIAPPSPNRADPEPDDVHPEPEPVSRSGTSPQPQFPNTGKDYSFAQIKSQVPGLTPSLAPRPGQSISLAAFMGSTAAGPRLTKMRGHDDQPDYASHPDAYAQRPEEFRAPGAAHPIFGVKREGYLQGRTFGTGSGIALPGLAKKEEPAPEPTVAAKDLYRSQVQTTTTTPNRDLFGPSSARGETISPPSAGSIYRSTSGASAGAGVRTELKVFMSQRFIQFS